MRPEDGTAISLKPALASCFRGGLPIAPKLLVVYAGREKNERLSCAITL